MFLPLLGKVRMGGNQYPPQPCLTRFAINGNSSAFHPLQSGRSLIREGVQARQKIRLEPCHCALVAQSFNYPSPFLPLPQGEGISSKFLKKKIAFTLAEGATHVALPDSQRKVAFTLAEVLITLGIIGVVAAMTMPSLINRTNKKELQVALSKTYSELNQAAMLFKELEGSSVSELAQRTGTSYIQSLNTFMNYFKGGQKVNDAKYSNTDDVKGYTIHSLNNKYSHTRLVCDTSGYYMDNIGRIFAFNDGPAANSNQNGPVICVDVNGEKRPNRYGYDIFLFIFTVDGRVIPMGQEDKNNPAAGSSENNDNNPLTVNGFVSGEEYCTFSGSAPKYGYSCAVYAISDTNPSDSSKTYWKDFLK